MMHNVRLLSYQSEIVSLSKHLVHFSILFECSNSILPFHSTDSRQPQDGWEEMEASKGRDGGDQIVDGNILIDWGGKERCQKMGRWVSLINR